MKHSILKKSFVKHIKYNPFKRPETDYVEGERNIAEGWVNGRDFRIHFCNSYGEESHAVGKVLSLWRLGFLYGRAYGYTGYKEGRFAIGFFWRGDRFFHLRVPAANSEYLAIRLGYELRKGK